MAQQTRTPQDNDQDERNNPGARNAENLLEKHGVLSQDEVDARRNQNGGDSQQKIADGESKPTDKQSIGDSTAGKAALGAASVAGGPIAGVATKFLGKIKTKKGGAGLGVIAIISVLLLIVGGFSAALAPIAFFTNVTNDLNDQVGALDSRSEKMMRTKITTQDRDQALKGCTKLSIKCKYKSLSSKDVERFKTAGIEVKGDTKFGRTFPNSYELGGKAYTPAEFANGLKTDPTIKQAFRQALNMRSLGFSDRIYAKVMSKFGISKAKPALTGDVDEELKNLATGEKAPGLTGDTKFIPSATEKDKFVIEGDSSGRTYTQAEVDTYMRSGVTTAVASGASKSLAQFAKVVNITGSADMYCSLKNAIGYAAVAAKYAKYAKLAKYVAPIAASVYAIKAGDATAKDGEVLGKFFSDTDDRKTIVDDQATFASGINENSPDQGMTEGNFALQTKANPYYGKNAMDSPLYQMSAMGGSPQKAAADGTSRYSLSLTENKVTAAIGLTAGFLSLGGNLNTSCDLIQNWLVRGASFVVGVAAMFTGLGEANMAKNIAVAVAVSAGFMFLAVFLSTITNEAPVSDDITEDPEERAAITWTGVSALTGETARMSGMIPAPAEELVAYSSLSKSSNLAYNAIERQTVSTWDTTSLYSPVSQVAMSLGKYKLTQLNATSLSNTLGTVISDAVSQPFSQQAFAAENDIARFQQCDDEAYAKMSIAADVQCNLRYIMPEKDLKMDPLEVAEYMEAQGFVEDDTETGLPPGYTEPSPSEMNIGGQILSGAINSVYSTRNYVNDYGRFLDYCVYRALPFGETYEESGAFQDVGGDWKTGKKCLDRDDYKIRAFRIYTMDKRLVDITEDPVVDSPIVETPLPQNPSASGFIWPIALKDFNKPPTNCYRKPGHTGIDISVPEGTSVLAMSDGTVVQAGDGGDAGNYIILRHLNNKYTVYQHNSRLLVKVGDTARTGQEIAKSGNSGFSTGPHLHFNLTTSEGIDSRDSVSISIDPVPFLPQDRNFGACR